MKHAVDFESLAEMMGPEDRDGESLTTGERRQLVRLMEKGELSPLALTNLRMLLQ